MTKVVQVTSSSVERTRSDQHLRSAKRKGKSVITKHFGKFSILQWYLFVIIDAENQQPIAADATSFGQSKLVG